jgi:flagellar motor component MotA
MSADTTMRIFFNLLLLLFALQLNAGIQKTDFDKSAFYSAMASNNINTVNAQLQIIKSSSINEKEAYEGALLMKKAGLITKVKEKLSLFKTGRLKLEAAIKKDKENAEYNFLRLIIQENAPKMVEYRNNIETDLSIIRSGFKTLTPVVQQAIQDYSKKSKVLKPL